MKYIEIPNRTPQISGTYPIPNSPFNKIIVMIGTKYNSIISGEQMSVQNLA